MDYELIDLFHFIIAVGLIYGIVAIFLAWLWR